MNSLSQLNSLAAITFDDQRTPTIIFDRPEPFNQSVTTNQNDTHYIPVGINIIDIIIPASVGINYTIDVSQQPDAEISWASLPTGVSVVNTTAGIYSIIGIDSVSDWEAVKSPLFQPDALFTGVFSYTATITWVGGSKSWTINMNILDITNMTIPSDFSFEKNDSGTVTGNPVILDNYATNWTVTVTPSNTSYISTLATAGTGGTSNFNATTKVLTITGSKTQVNTHLNSITYLTTMSAIEDFTLGYLAINDTTGEADYKLQNWLTLEYLFMTRANDQYSLNTQSAITNGPLINDASYDGSGNYIMTITPTVPEALYSLSSEGRYFWAPGNEIATPGSGYLEVCWAATSNLSKYAVSNSSVSTTIGKYLYDGSLLDLKTYGNVYVYTRSGNDLILANRFYATAQSTAGVTNQFGQQFSATPDLTKFAIAARGEEGAESPSQDRGSIYIMTPNAAEIEGSIINYTSTNKKLAISSITSGSVNNGMLLWKTTDTDFSEPIWIVNGGSGLDDKTINVNVEEYTGTFIGTSVTRIPSPSSSDYFRGAYINSAGTSVAIYAYSGSDAWVYIYDLVSSTWTFRDKFQGATWEFGKPAGNSFDKTGMVFIDDTTLLVTDVREDSYSGTVSIYTKSGSTWSLNVKLSNPTALTNSFFGNTIKVNSATEIEVWADCPDLFQSIRKHVYTLVSGTWTFSSTTAISYAGKSQYQILPITTTSDGEYRVGPGSQVYRDSGTGFNEYSLLSTANDTFFLAVISADGEYIVGHRALSTSLKYLRVFVKTANDPNASSWNPTTKTLTLQGTREFINSEIDTLLLTPSDDYDLDIVLTYTLTTPRGDTDSRIQTITYTS